MRSRLRLTTKNRSARVINQIDEFLGIRWRKVRICDLKGIQKDLSVESVNYYVRRFKKRGLLGSFVNPIMVVRDRHGLMLTDGHHRVEAARSIGRKWIMARVFELDKTFAKYKYRRRA
jgi:hypothetical protein